MTITTIIQTTFINYKPLATVDFIFQNSREPEKINERIPRL